VRLAKDTNKRAADLRFLARIRAASLSELGRMLLAHRSAPEWKVAAIKVAMKRVMRSEAA
jgi:hypothetical protein